jgi:hypothetical protein
VSRTLRAAKSAGRLKQELQKYPQPALLILDERGYLPLDKAGADLLCHVISLRYEQGASVITSNRTFKDWPKIFNHDSTLTAAILDRLLHHTETVIIEGKSVRMKDQIEGEPSLHTASPEAHRPCRRRPAHPCASHIFKPPIFLHFHAVANRGETVGLVRVLVLAMGQRGIMCSVASKTRDRSLSAMCQRGSIMDYSSSTRHQ